MFIIPFTHKTCILNNINIHVFTILTIGGNKLWKEHPSLDIQSDILLPNSIYLLQDPIKYKTAYLCQIDESKMDMNDFYKWDELKVDDNQTFCWRVFYTFGKDKEYCSWLPIPEYETFGDYSYNELFKVMSQYISSKPFSL